MRDIKFRAWDKKNGRMFHIENLFFDDTNYRALTIRDHDLFLHLDEQEVELMQFTGLTDKNGTDIYEGDVYDVGICTKVIRPDHFIEDTYELMKLIEDGATIEVIGNIHDNPNLLKSEAK